MTIPSTHTKPSTHLEQKLPDDDDVLGIAQCFTCALPEDGQQVPGQWHGFQSAAETSQTRCTIQLACDLDQQDGQSTAPVNLSFAAYKTWQITSISQVSRRIRECSEVCGMSAAFLVGS